MTTTEIHPTDRGLVRDCEQFDLHIDWLRNGWGNQDPLLQAIYEISNPHHANLIRRTHGYGDFEISVGFTPIYGEPIILSIDKQKAVDNILVNTASFYEGEIRRCIDLGLPDYHFEPFNTVANNKTQLRAEIKRYGKYLHEKYSGDYGKIYIKYY